MRILYIWLLACLCYCLANGQILSFQRGKNIWIKNLVTGAEQLLCEGHDPKISPNGKEVAFTVYGKESGRSIAVIDIQTRRIRLFDSITSNNCYGPEWTPDGHTLIFNYRNYNRWRLALVKSNGDSCLLLPNIGNRDAYSPIWLSNDRFICQDMEFLHFVDRTGNIQRSLSINSIASNIGESSSSEVLVSNDSLCMLFDGSVIEPLKDDITGLDRPTFAIYRYDVRQKRCERISPPGMYADQPRWINETDILFSGFTKRDIITRTDGYQITRHIYVYFSKDKRIKRIIRNGDQASCSMSD